MTPSIYRIYKNPLYSGAIFQLILEDGVSYGRVAYDPNDPHPGTGNEYDQLPDPTLGMDGNLYTLQATYEDGDYQLELVRWVIAWDGSEPPAGSVVASAVVGGLEPSFATRAVGYLLPGSDGIQAFFMPYTSGSDTTVALSPGQVPQVFSECRIPTGFEYGGQREPEDRVLGLFSGGLHVLGLGGRLV
ncbi:hypothetical protein N619_01035 [Ectopseudomonas oleovorans]|nr:hypothetical protein N619_01035 [Pseudomonas oleovorans]